MAYIGNKPPVQYDDLAGKPNLSAVATSGNYDDLLNTPTIPSISGLATETYVDTAISNLVDTAPETLNTLNELAAALGDDASFSTTVTNQIALKANTSDLATVATSGSYTDLTNRPSLATVATSGSYTDLTNKPTIPADVSELTDTTNLLAGGGGSSVNEGGVLKSDRNSLTIAQSTISLGEISAIEEVPISGGATYTTFEFTYYALPYVNDNTWVAVKMNATYYQNVFLPYYMANVYNADGNHWGLRFGSIGDDGSGFVLAPGEGDYYTEFSLYSEPPYESIDFTGYAPNLVFIGNTATPDANGEVFIVIGMLNGWSNDFETTLDIRQLDTRYTNQEVYTNFAASYSDYPKTYYKHIFINNPDTIPNILANADQDSYSNYLSSSTSAYGVTSFGLTTDYEGYGIYETGNNYITFTQRNNSYMVVGSTVELLVGGVSSLQILAKRYDNNLSIAALNIDSETGYFQFDGRALYNLPTPKLFYWGYDYYNNDVSGYMLRANATNMLTDGDIFYLDLYPWDSKEITSAIKNDLYNPTTFSCTIVGASEFGGYQIAYNNNGNIEYYDQIVFNNSAITRIDFVFNGSYWQMKFY